MKKWFPKTGMALCAIAGMLLFAHCKKDKQDNPKDPSFKEFLIGKKWQLSAYTANPGMDDGEGHVITDIYAVFPACMKDDFTEYFADGTGAEDEGATKCAAGNPQRRTFNWNLKADGTLEGRGDDDFTGTYRAEKISNTSYKVTGTGHFKDDPAQRTIVLTFKAI
ncbi:hypothetical protein ACTJJB_27795 [Chitinophaga sp. 22536]|uniref:hypothetical protein n=1 Tax=unclassified Chitinophaga TaxID=2619133 RepID=UPI003F878372